MEDLGPAEEDCHEAIVLNRIVRWTPAGLEYEADPKHREKVLEHFGFDDKSRALTHNGDVEPKDESDWALDFKELDAVVQHIQNSLDGCKEAFVEVQLPNVESSSLSR